MSAKRVAFDRAIEQWNKGSLDGYLELYDDGIKLHGYSEAPMDKETVRGFYGDLWSALGDMRLAIHEVVEDDDRLCARFTLTGVHRGELAGVPATGATVTQNGITILRFDGDRCVERWSVADMLSVLMQIGALPG
jgi:steroid delta-isomerase-like uncharacterized protein